MAFIGVAFIWCGVGVLLCLFCWHIVAFCFSLGVALRHRPGAELQVSGLFLQFMCAILAIYSCNLVLLRVVVGAEFFSVFSSPFYGPFFLNCSQLFFGVFLEPLSVFSLDLEAFLLSSYVVAQSTCVGSFVRVFEFLRMPTTRPTFNSLSKDLFPAPSMSAPPSSGDSVAVSTVVSGTSNSHPNEIVVAVAQAL